MERILRASVAALLTLAVAAAALVTADPADRVGTVATAAGARTITAPTGMDGRPASAAAEATAVATSAALDIQGADARSASVPPSARVTPRMDRVLKRQLSTAALTDELTVFVHGTSAASAAEAAQRAGMKVLWRYNAVGVAVAHGPARAVRALATTKGLSYLEADAPLTYFMDSSHDATRGNEARRGFTVSYDEPQPPKPGTSRRVCSTQRRNGRRVRTCRTVTSPPTPRPPIRRTLTSAPVDGSGVSIAVIDSGIDANHPMFMKDGQSKVARNYKIATAACIVTTCDDPEAGVDESIFVPVTSSDTLAAGGHGTHVAGIAAGYDVRTATGIELHGAAPGATLIGLGAGATPLHLLFTTAGLNWVLEHHADPCGDGSCPPIKVVNNSYGGTGEFDPESTTTKLQDALAAANVVTVWAAGNGDTTNDGGDGSDNRVNPTSVNPTPGIISVANAHDGDTGDRDNALDPSSSRGQKGRLGTYPDVTAPGSSILSACMPTLAVCRGTDVRDPYYGTIGGTSMASPHVAGIVAQMFQANPGLTPAMVEDALEDTAHPFAFGGSYEPDTLNDGMTSFDKGHGMVDVVGAVARARSFPVFPAKAICAADAPIATDIAGDATDVAAAEDTAVPSEPALDLTALRAEWASGILRFVLSVKDLPDEPLLNGSNGESFNVFFTHRGTEVQANATRTATGDPTFTVSDGPAVTGAFDPAADTVTIEVPAAAVSAEDGLALPPLKDGTPLVNLHAWSRRSLGALAPVADRANGRCPYTLGLGPVPAPRYVTTGPDPAPVAAYVPGPPEAAVAVGQSYGWDGGPFVHAGVGTTAPGIAFDCDGGVRPGDDCDRRFIELRVPGGGAKLTVTITPSSPEADFDLYVYGPDGNEVGSSAGMPLVDHPESIESFTIDVTVPGVYRIDVNPFTAVGSSYAGEIKLTA